MNYWDTSALLKLYVREDHSSYFLDLAVTWDQPIVSSALAAAEMLCAVNGKECVGDLKSGGALAAEVSRRAAVTARATVMVATDARLRKVAEMAKLKLAP